MRESGLLSVDVSKVGLSARVIRFNFTELSRGYTVFAFLLLPPRRGSLYLSSPLIAASRHLLLSGEGYASETFLLGLYRQSFTFEPGMPNA